MSASLAAAAASGYGIAAGILGLPVRQVRPTDATGLLNATTIGQPPAYFDQDPAVGMKRAWNRIKAEGYVCIDPTVVAVGDYLIGSDTYFVQRVEPFRAVEVVLCNRTLAFSNEAPSAPETPGANPYAAPNPALSSDIASDWPASVLLKTRGEADAARLPSDVRAAYFEALVPAIPGVALQSGYRATDEIGNAYQLVSVELTHWGYRLLILTNQV